MIEYVQRLYRPADRRVRHLSENDFGRAKALAEWKARVHQHWPEVKVEGLETNAGDQLAVGAELELRASVRLGQLSPDDVAVEIYEGALDAEQDIGLGRATLMAFVGVEKGVALFVGHVRCQTSGLHGYTVRVLPRHRDLANPFEPRLIVWGG